MTSPKVQASYTLRVQMSKKTEQLHILVLSDSIQQKQQQRELRFNNSNKVLNLTPVAKFNLSPSLNHECVDQPGQRHIYRETGMNSNTPKVQELRKKFPPKKFLDTDIKGRVNGY